MTSRSGPLLALSVIALLAGVYLLNPFGKAAPVTPRPAPEPLDEVPEVPNTRPVEPLVGRRPAPKPVVSVDSTAGFIRLWDKSFVPCLNGVQGSPEIQWGGGVFSPIDYVVVDRNGIEWYVLKNGDYLTTATVPGKDETGAVVMRDLLVHHKKTDALPVGQPDTFIPDKRK